VSQPSHSNAQSPAASDEDAPGWPPRAGLAALVPLVLVIYASLIPMEARLIIGGQNVYPVRIMLFLLVPWLARQLARGELRIRLPDYLMLAAGTWMVLSFVVFYGFTNGFLRGFALAFDMVMPYLVGRLCIRSFDDLRRVLVLAAPGFAVAGLLMAFESLTQTQVVRPLFEQMFRPLAAYENGVAIGDAEQFQLYRMGLMRAQGPFLHPILAGIYMASLLPIYALSGLRGWPLALGLLAGFCSLFSVSSAAVLVLLIAALLIGYDIVQRRVAFLSWPQFVGFGALAALLIQLGSQNGLVPIFIRYTLDPATAAYRLLIWDYGTLSVARNPLFGIGFTDFERLFWMGASVDNHWLLLGIRHGLLVPVLVVAAVAIVIAMLSAVLRYLPPHDRAMGMACIAAFFALAIAGFSVALVGGALAWFFALQGALARDGASSAITVAGWAGRGRRTPLPSDS